MIVKVQILYPGLFFAIQPPLPQQIIQLLFIFIITHADIIQHRALLQQLKIAE